MSDGKPKVFAAHLDSEASKAAHPFWYRFGGDVLWFTFDSVEAVPEKCHCGEKFYLPPEGNRGYDAVAVSEYATEAKL